MACRTANPTLFLRPVVGSASVLCGTAMQWRFGVRWRHAERGLRADLLLDVLRMFIRAKSDRVRVLRGL